MRPTDDTRPAGVRPPTSLPSRRPLLRRAGRPVLVALLAVLLLMKMPGIPNALADDDGERARAALQAGQIRPLPQVLDAVSRQWHGEIIAVELDREDGRWVYEVKLLAPQGSVIKLEYDAQQVTLLKAKGRGLKEARKEP